MNIISNHNPRSLIQHFQSDTFVFSTNSIFDSLKISSHSTREFSYKATGLTLLTGGMYAIVSRSFLFSPLLAGAFFLYANSQRFSTEAKLRDPVYFSQVKAEVEKIRSEETEASAIVYRLPESIEDLNRHNLLSNTEAELFSIIQKATQEMKKLVEKYKAPLKQMQKEIELPHLHGYGYEETMEIKNCLETWLGKIEKDEVDAFKTAKGMNRLLDTLLIQRMFYYRKSTATHFLLEFFCRRDQYDKIKDNIDVINEVYLTMHARDFNRANDKYKELLKKEAKKPA